MILLEMILDILLVLLVIAAFVGLLYFIVWSGTALVCLISDAIDMWRSIFGGKK